MTPNKGRLRGEAHAAIYERFLYSELSDKAVRLLCVLDRCQNLGLAYPGRAWLAERVGCSADTVDRTLRELEGGGAITTTKTKRPGGGHPLVTYYVWPAVPELDEQLRMDAELQVRTGAKSRVRGGAAASPQPARNPQGVTTNSEQEKVIDSCAASASMATDDPVKRRAHQLAVLAHEQTPAPVTRGGFPAVLDRIEEQLRAGTTVQALERAIRAAPITWTRDGLSAAIGMSNPRQRERGNSDGDTRSVTDLRKAARGAQR